MQENRQNKTKNKTKTTRKTPLRSSPEAGREDGDIADAGRAGEARVEADGVFEATAALSDVLGLPKYLEALGKREVI